jgi:hypothetical protein
MKKVNCDNNMSFIDCELAILRSAVDLAQEQKGKRVVSSKDIKHIIEIVELFLRNKKLVCYGGTAINNILPEDNQFYNKETDIPDYDFYSPNALDDTIELADLYYSKGYTEVEAKAAQHFGTYKVYVNFFPIADITLVSKDLFKSIQLDSISKKGILYCPPNFLRMSMYLELSRPQGDTTRWEKVMKRLVLLNEYYPLTLKKCSNENFQRKMFNKQREEEIYETVKQAFRDQGCVFFGGYAISMYAKYMPEEQKKYLQSIPDFDVLSNDPEKVSSIVKKKLTDIRIKNVSVKKRDPIGEIIPEHYEICVGKDTIAFVYKPIGCHSYNIYDNDTKIATIDTMLSFYLAFLYANRPYYDTDRIVCMSEYLFKVQQENRLSQHGLLKRFSLTCYGYQKSVEQVKEEKAKKFRELKNKRGTREYNEWFLSYKPYLNQLYSDKTYTSIENPTENSKKNTLDSVSETDVISQEEENSKLVQPKPTPKKIKTEKKKKNIKKIGTIRRKKNVCKSVKDIKLTEKKELKNLEEQKEPKNPKKNKKVPTVEEEEEDEEEEIEYVFW